MSNTKIHPGDKPPPAMQARAPSWRSSLVGIGVVCTIGAMFVGAASKGAAGPLPRVLAIAGVLLVAAAVAMKIMAGVSTTLNRRKGTNIQSRPWTRSDSPEDIEFWEARGQGATA